MNLILITQARMNSTRFPGKVLKYVLEKPLLEYHIERLKKVKRVRKLIVATTANKDDDPIALLCQKLDVDFFRGSENDVLDRFYNVGLLFGADAIVRATSDCPLIDPQVIDNTVEYYLDNNSRYDYVSNCLKRTYPRGMDIEVFSFNSLKEAFLEATKQPDREHVTSFIYMQAERYRLSNFEYKQNLSHHRWTVDTPDDFALIRKIIEHLYPSNPQFTLEDCLELLKKYPEWIKLNCHIEQKYYGQ